MPIVNGQQIDAADFIDESDGSAGKVPVTKAGGKIDESFIPNTVPIVRTYLNSGSPHTWTKPANLKYVIVEVQGGGSAGGSPSGSDVSGPGGSAGGYARKLIPASDLDATETVTVGAAGGTSSFTNNGVTVQGTGATLTTPGVGSGGDVNVNGQIGEPIGPDTLRHGKGGNSPLGTGGWAQGGDASGTAGTGYGSGGGGGSQSGSTGGGAGGAGAPGVVIVTEYYI